MVRTCLLTLMTCALASPSMAQDDAETNSSMMPSTPVFDVTSLAWTVAPVEVAQGQQVSTDVRVIIPAGVDALHYELGVEVVDAHGFVVDEIKPSRGIWRRRAGPQGDYIAVGVPLEAATVDVGLHEVNLRAYLRACVERRCIMTHDVPVSVLVQVKPRDRSPPHHEHAR